MNDPFSESLRQARADLQSAIGLTERAAFAAGVEAAARYVDRVGQERGGYFGQTAAAIADMLRVAAEISREHAKG